MFGEEKKQRGVSLSFPCVYEGRGEEGQKRGQVRGKGKGKEFERREVGNGWGVGSLRSMGRARLNERGEEGQENRKSLVV